MQKKSTDKILSREFITKTDIQMLFGIGTVKAAELFVKVQRQVEEEGKLNIPGRISWKRMYRMLGLPIPKLEEVEKVG